MARKPGAAKTRRSAAAKKETEIKKETGVKRAAAAETAAAAEAKAKAEAEAKAKKEAEAKAKKEAEAKAKAEAEAKAKKEAEAKVKKEAEAKVKKEAEAKAKAEAEAKEKKEAEAKVKAEAEAKAKKEAEAKAKKEAEAKAKAEAEAKAEKEESDRIFMEHDELRWLYMELYGNDDMFAELCGQMKWYYDQRNDKLKKLDAEREAAGEWYRKRDMLGMMMYIDNFAGNIKGVQEKLPYLEKCNVNYIHLMPFLDSPKGRSDGGYAVADFRKVKPELGTMDDLAELAEKCHEKGISLCMDFVMNHTSEDHEWAKRARQGDGEYMSRYFFYADPSIPQEYEKTVPQVFPTTAPGNFTYLPELGHYVMTTACVQRDDVQFPLPGKPGNGYYPHRCGSLYLERTWDELQESSAGAHHRPYDAYDRRDRLSGDCASRRGGHGAGQGGAILWHGRETGVPHALQCNYHGDDMAYSGDERYPPAEKTDGYRVCTSEGIYIPQLLKVP